MFRNRTKNKRETYKTMLRNDKEKNFFITPKEIDDIIENDKTYDDMLDYLFDNSDMNYFEEMKLYEDYD